MNQDKTFLGTEPIGKLLRQLAVPTVIAQLVNMLYNIVDRIYIGHIPGNGDLALTGVGVCLPLILIVSAFAALVASGGAPRASIYMGKQDHATAEKILGGCFALQLIVSAVLTAVLLLWNRPLLLTFGASGNTIDYAAAYMSVYAIGTVFVQLTLGMNAFITAQGFAQIGMRTVLIGAVANIVLDPLFIFALNMGVRGAALATIISQCLSCVWVLRFLTGPKTMLRLKKENIRIAPALVLPCVALGSATFIMQASESVISMCFNSSLLKYGGDIAVGAMTILSSVMQFAMLPLQGIGQGAQPIISYNYGARNTERVRRTFWLLLRVSLCYSVLLWAIIQLFPGVFARMFTPKAELIDFTVTALRIYCGALFLFGIQIACQMAFVSIGAAGCSIIVAVLRKFVLLLPLIYLLVNVKIAQLGESFPITIVTFLPVLLLLFLERISVKKLMIALGIGAGLTAFNYLFGQSLDASKYVTSTMLFVYIVIIIGMVWSIRFKTISPHNHRKILRFFYLVVGLVVALAAVEMAQIILTGGSSIMESISKYLIYSNSYVLNFIKFGGKRTTALYFEPAFFALALISIWLSIKQFGIKTPKTDAMILAGIILSGSFSGVMTFILFYLLEWAFQYLNKEAIKKKLPLALISLAVFLVGVVIAFPYISTRLGDLGTEGSSSYYRIVGPLVMVGYSLTHIDGVVRFGSLYEYVASFGIFNGADVGKTIDNGLYLLIIYFSWFAVFLSLWYMGKVIKMMINAFGDNRNFRVQLYLFTPVSLFFTGSIFSPEYAFLIVCPFILRKALNITR